MRTALASRLTPAELGKLEHPTPYLLLDLDVVQDAYHALTDALPEVAIRYAVKCNPDLRILARHPRPRRRRLCPPGRPRLGSTVPSEGKFGIDPDHAVQLMQTARSLGLRPYGIAFHVGSQMTQPHAWEAAIRHSAAVLRAPKPHRITLQMLDIGGGFPARYTEPIPDLTDYGACIRQAVQRHLPYPIQLVAEPGRGPAGLSPRRLARPPATPPLPRHRADLRQPGHHVLRRHPLRRAGPGRPGLHLHRRCLHHLLRLHLQQLRRPTTYCVR